jgi:very-short-patch-repair endonuclease
MNKVFKELKRQDKAWKKNHAKNKIRKPKIDPEIIKDKQRKLYPRQRSLAKRQTEEEIIFKEYLEYYGIKYVFQKGFIAGDGFCIADFYLPEFNMVVEIDGKYHETAKQKIRDHFKDKYYAKRKMKVLRIKNEDVETFPISYFQNLTDKIIKPVM